MKIAKYSFGTGDRFSHQGEAQLRAILKGRKAGIDVVPVWNKSFREHSIVHSEPGDTRTEADAAVNALNYSGQYFVDADHINMANVEGFIAASNFFTLDVAGKIGEPSSEKDIEQFIDSCKGLNGEIKIPGITSPIVVDESKIRDIANNFLAAINEAANIYNYIKENKEGDFVTEVSMDEVESPQTPVELLFILKMIADKGIPAQTIAPKFTGRFNKGVDYVGDLDQFAQEFEEDVLVIDYAVKNFGLPEDLKLSVHSGSDKFSIYPVMAGIIKKYDKGIHVKTAGTTWLEEVIGLAVAGNEALEMAKSIYIKALNRSEELCAPYADVIDIDENKLPTAEEVQSWDSEKFANTLRHIPDHPDYNPNFRQLIHVGYKVASEYGEEYNAMLKKYSEVIGGCVEENIYDRHLKRLFNL